MTSDQISAARQTFLGCVYRNAQSSPCEIGRLFARTSNDHKGLTAEVVKLMDAAFTVALAESQDLRMQLADLQTEVARLKDEAHQDGMIRVRYGAQFDALQTELAKARELLVRCQTRLSHCSLLDDVRKFLAHQSAPAAKDGE